MGVGVGAAVGVAVGVAAGAVVGVGVGLEHPSNTASRETATQDSNFDMDTPPILRLGGLWPVEGGGLALIVSQGPRANRMERERDSSGRPHVNGQQQDGRTSAS